MLKTVAQGLRKAFATAAGLAPAVIRDLAGLAGIGLIAYGSWLIYPPAGFIVGGVLLAAGALVSARA